MIYVTYCIKLLLLVADMSRITRATAAFENNLDKANNFDTSVSRDVAVADVLTIYENITSTSFEIPYSKKPIFCTSIGSPSAKLSLIFTQGAGGDLTSPAVTNFVEGFSELKKIVCFQGRGNLMSRTNMFKEVIKHHHCNVLGGRSLGSRAAIATAKEIDNVEALILVSYPLRGDKGDVRDQLILDIDEGIDVLFVIGDKDRMCDLNHLTSLRKQMKAKTWIVVVKNADHGMDIRPAEATRTVGKKVGETVAEWIDERNETLTECEIHWDEDQNDVIVGPWNDGT